MKTSKKFADLVEIACPTDSGDTQGRRLNWNAALLEKNIKALKGAITVHQNGSHDPSWDVVFPDGSTCHVGNPDQHSFRGFVVAS